VPGAGDEVGGFAVDEGLLGDVRGHRDDEVAVGPHLGEVIGEGVAPVAAHSQFGGVGAVGVALEDLGAEGGLDGVEVVRITGGLGLAGGEGILRDAGVHEPVAFGEEIVEGFRGVIGHRVVPQEGDVLDDEGHAVVAAVVRDGLQGDVDEVVLRVDEVDGGYGTVVDHLAEHVVRGHDDVGAFPGGDLGKEVGEHLAVVVALDDADAHTRVLLETLGDLLQAGDLVLGGPDGQGAGSAEEGTGAGGLTATAAAGGECSTRDEQSGRAEEPAAGETWGVHRTRTSSVRSDSPVSPSKRYRDSGVNHRSMVSPPATRVALVRRATSSPPSSSTPASWAASRAASVGFSTSGGEKYTK